ncbi:MAG: Dabb family protein [Acidimicrobiales bacterium]|nr:Dabb family protein [Acidimicrobiales bacterium]
MIRHVLLFRLKPGVTDEQVDHMRAALAAIPFAGRSSFVFGRDLGLREGNMDVAVISDFPDEATYKAWADDPEHRRVTAESVSPLVERLERCQFLVE